MKQFIAITMMSLMTIPQRLGSVGVIVIGIGGVVAVLVSMLAMSAGFRHTVAAGGRSDRVVVLRGGSDAELSSNLTRPEISLIGNAPGLAKDSEGKFELSPELVSVVNIPKMDTGTDANITMRGVGEQSVNVRPELKIITGRYFKPGVRELIAGEGATKQFRGLTVGSVVRLRGTEWRITGVFTSAGDIHESELLTDVDTLASALERGGYSSAIGALTDAAAFTGFKDALTADPQLKVEVLREVDYYSAQSKQLAQTINVIGNTVAAIMALGAMFGALNTMYAAVAARGLEIATLRAIGFKAAPVLFAVMSESMIIALVGGLLGSAAAWLLFNGHSVSTLGGAFAQVVFKITVTPALVTLGLIWACFIGLLGGLFPAVRAARLPIAEALRAA
jgi:putative ABC transport system permease protein